MGVRGRSIHITIKKNAFSSLSQQILKSNIPSTNFPLDTHENKNVTVSQSKKLRMLINLWVPREIPNNQNFWEAALRQKKKKKKVGTHTERQISIFNHWIIYKIFSNQRQYGDLLANPFSKLQNKTNKTKHPSFLSFIKFQIMKWKLDKSRYKTVFDIQRCSAGNEKMAEADKMMG